MTDKPDIEQLARRYLDLWQDQTAALITDPELAGAMGQAYAMVSKGLAACFVDGGPANKEGEADFTDVRAAASSKPSPAAPWSAPVAATAGEPSRDSSDLATRVAALEERIRRLEAALGASGGGDQAAS
jgi:hypothetical protein